MIACTARKSKSDRAMHLDALEIRYNAGSSIYWIC